MAKALSMAEALSGTTAIDRRGDMSLSRTPGGNYARRTGGVLDPRGTPLPTVQAPPLQPAIRTGPTGSEQFKQTAAELNTRAPGMAGMVAGNAAPTVGAGLYDRAAAGFDKNRDAISLALAGAAQAVMGPYQDSWQANVGRQMEGHVRQKRKAAGMAALISGENPTKDQLAELAPGEIQEFMKTRSQLKNEKLTRARDTIKTIQDIRAQGGEVSPQMLRALERAGEELSADVLGSATSVQSDVERQGAMDKTRIEAEKGAQLEVLDAEKNWAMKLLKQSGVQDNVLEKLRQSGQIDALWEEHMLGERGLQNRTRFYAGLAQAVAQVSEAGGLELDPSVFGQIFQAAWGNPDALGGIKATGAAGEETGGVDAEIDRYAKDQPAATTKVAGRPDSASREITSAPSPSFKYPARFATVGGGAIQPNSIPDLLARGKKKEEK